MLTIRSRKYFALSATIVLITILLCACGPLTSSSPYPSYGRDTRWIIGDGKFQILDVNGNTALGIFPPNSSANKGMFQMLLANLTSKNYRAIGNIVYIASKTDGYAEIDGKTDICRIFQFTNASVKQYYQWPELVNDPSIVYLSSFNDFTSDEQKVLQSLK